jgi:hypothetical protein
LSYLGICNPDVKSRVEEAKLSIKLGDKESIQEKTPVYRRRQVLAGEEQRQVVLEYRWSLTDSQWFDLQCLNFTVV